MATKTTLSILRVVLENESAVIKSTLWIQALSPCAWRCLPVCGSAQAPRPHWSVWWLCARLKVIVVLLFCGLRGWEVSPTICPLYSSYCPARAHFCHDLRPSDDTLLGWVHLLSSLNCRVLLQGRHMAWSFGIYAMCSFSHVRSLQCGEWPAHLQDVLLYTTEYLQRK